MTGLQIEYAKHLEQARHNAELERQGRDTISETVRSNQAREGETHRANLAQESLKGELNDITDRHYLRGDTENKRHSLVTESLDLGKLYEQSRHNLASENAQNVSNALTGMSTALQYDVGLKNAEASSQRSQAALKTAETGALAQTWRQNVDSANLVREGALATSKIQNDAAQRALQQEQTRTQVSQQRVNRANELSTQINSAKTIIDAAVNIGRLLTGKKGSAR